jgi:hypothetical protein
LVELEGLRLRSDCGVKSPGRHKCDFFALPEEKQLEYLPLLDPWFGEVHESRILDMLRRRAEPLDPEKGNE